MTKLCLKDVSRRFGPVTAVDACSLSLETGEFVSLLGPSGCGKTTTLRMIAGFLAPSAGTIEMDGEVISSPASSLPPEKRNMSMIFQSYAIWPNMTVAQNVAFGLEVRRLPREVIRDKVDRILDVVQMKHLRDRYPQELSARGVRGRRDGLARAGPAAARSHRLSRHDGSKRPQGVWRYKNAQGQFPFYSLCRD